MNKKADEYRSLGVELEGTGSGGDRFSLRRLKTFESFKTSVFRVYYGAMVGQWVAMSMQMMSSNLLVYRLTGSEATIGVMALALSIPSLLVALFGGAIADRMQKKYILLIGQVGSAVVSLGVAFALSLGYLSPERWWLLVVVAVLQGIVFGFMTPSHMAIIPEIVGGEQVMNAISLSTMGQKVFQLVGPVLAGFLIDAYDFAAVYYLMTGMYIIATIFVLFLPRTGVTATREGSPLGDVIGGLRYIWRDSTFLLIVVFGVCHMISGIPYQQLMPVFTEDILKVDASGMGILLAVSGVGATLSALALASLPNRKRGVLLLLSGVIMGLALIVFSWSSWWYLSLGIVFFAGMGPTMHSALTSTLIQYYVDPDYRGRMQSFVMMGMGLGSLGTFLAGVLSEVIGVQWSVGGMAIFITIVSIAFLLFARKVTKLE